MRFFRRVKEGCVMPIWGIAWTSVHQYSQFVGDYYVLFVSLGLGRRLRLTWQLIWNKESL